MKWVKPIISHYSSFLGEISSNKVFSVQKCLLTFKSILLFFKFSGLGFFPNLKIPGFWIGIKEQPELWRLKTL